VQNILCQEGARKKDKISGRKLGVSVFVPDTGKRVGELTIQPLQREALYWEGAS